MGTAGICGSRPQTGEVSPQLAEAVLLADQAASQMGSDNAQRGSTRSFEWPCAPSSRTDHTRLHRQLGPNEGTPWEADSDTLSSASFLEDDGEGPDSIRLKTLIGGDEEADCSEDSDDDASSGDFAPRDVHPLLILQSRAVEANGRYGWSSGDDKAAPLGILGERLFLSPVAENGHRRMGSPNLEGSSDFSTSVGQVESED
mmetsp:Transcript_24458/g.56319  ORF Transcript_24458/g.56319 Transcript_24458/m.56319 type:complete len:201 (-) Transcript_24458:88-690(-)